MKILMRILGVLLLFGGLGLAGLMLTGNLVHRQEVWHNDTTAKLEKAEKDYQIEPTEEKKKSVESWRKNVDESGKLLNERKRNQTFGIIGGGAMGILGIGIFGLSFIFGKKLN